MDRRITRQVVLILALLWLAALAASSGLAAARSLERSWVVRSLLKAGASLPKAQLSQPFLCLRLPLEAETARSAAIEAWVKLQSEPADVEAMRLQLAAGCLLGERQTVEIGWQDPVPDPYLFIQETIAQNAAQPEELARELLTSGLSQTELLALAKTIYTNQVDLDLRPLLRELGQPASQKQELWLLWLQTGLQLEHQSDWQGAGAWFEEGQVLKASNGVRFYASSFDLHIGRTYQIHHEPHDPQAALAYYNRALAARSWWYPSEEASAHLFRGEVYRSLNDNHTPAEALAEFERALALQPGSYWAELSIGHVYLYDLKDPAEAESYYQRALAKRPELPNTYFHLGDLYRMLGDSAQAEAWYRQALARQPDYQPALNGLKSLGVSP